MLYYLVLLVFAYFIYTLTFDQEKRMVNKINKSTKKRESEYKKVDKLYLAEQQKKNRKALDVIVKFKLMSEEKLQETLRELKISGEQNPIQYVLDYFLLVIIMFAFGLLTMFMGAVITKLLSVKFMGMAFELLGIVLVISGGFQLFTVSSLAQKRRQANIKEIEDDYNKLLTHLYYYYGTSDKSYMLSDVLGKFNSPVSKSTTAMIDGIIEDCKKGELQALENVKIRYCQSIKIVNLADKLERCIDGFELGPVYIKSLHAQMIAEEDASRENKEQAKNELYTVVMCICMVTVMFLQIIGIGSTFLKGGKF